MRVELKWVFILLDSSSCWLSCVILANLYSDSLHSGHPFLVRVVSLTVSWTEKQLNIFIHESVNCPLPTVFNSSRREKRKDKTWETSTTTTDQKTTPSMRRWLRQQTSSLRWGHEVRTKIYWNRSPSVSSILDFVTFLTLSSFTRKIFIRVLLLYPLYSGSLTSVLQCWECRWHIHDACRDDLEVRHQEMHSLAWLSHSVLQERVL